MSVPRRNAAAAAEIVERTGSLDSGELDALGRAQRRAAGFLGFGQPYAKAAAALRGAVEAAGRQAAVQEATNETLREVVASVSASAASAGRDTSALSAIEARFERAVSERDAQARDETARDLVAALRTVAGKKAGGRAALAALAAGNAAGVALCWDLAGKGAYSKADRSLLIGPWLAVAKLPASLT